MSQKKRERILITGASGMLGRALVDEFQNPKSKFQIELIPTDLPELDITHSSATQKIIALNPSIVIHLAAYTNVDACEVEPDRAWKVNSLGTKNVALACKNLNIPILYISTDYVFDGEKPTPYVEWDLPNPLNIYGQTKLEGELWIRRLVKKYWIVRTSGLYGKWGKNFVATILKKAKESGELKVVADQIGSPTYTMDLATAILKLITNYQQLITLSPEATNFGVYHITNSGWVSWYEFAKTIIEIADLQCNVLPINSNEINRPARRPKNWRLLNFMWEGKPLRQWKEALNEYLAHNRGEH